MAVQNLTARARARIRGGRERKRKGKRRDMQRRLPFKCAVEPTTEYADLYSKRLHSTQYG